MENYFFLLLRMWGRKLNVDVCLWETLYTYWKINVKVIWEFFSIFFFSSCSSNFFCSYRMRFSLKGWDLKIDLMRMLFFFICAEEKEGIPIRENENKKKLYFIQITHFPVEIYNWSYEYQWTIGNLKKITPLYISHSRLLLIIGFYFHLSAGNFSYKNGTGKKRERHSEMFNEIIWRFILKAFVF